MKRPGQRTIPFQPIAIDARDRCLICAGSGWRILVDENGNRRATRCQCVARRVEQRRGVTVAAVHDFKLAAAGER